MLKYFDLQLFSEEKTEQPTSKKIRDARDKGQIAQSKDLNDAVSLLAVFMSFSFLSSYFVDNLIGYYYFTMDLTVDTAALFTSNGIALFFNETIFTILKLSLPLLLIALTSGLLVSYIQVGFMFTTETLKPKFEKIDPVKGFKNMFSSRALVEMVKSIAKAILIIYVAVSYIMDNMRDLLITLELDMGPIVLEIGRASWRGKVYI